MSCTKFLLVKCLFIRSRRILQQYVVFRAKGVMKTSKRGVGKLIKWKSHLEKTKNTRELQNQFAVSTQL